MHVFLLSLPDSRQRRLSAIGKLRTCNIPFDIVDGVEAGKWKLDCLLCQPDVRSWMKASEIGCYMAHLRAMQRLIDYGLPYACVLEDDFCFEANPDWGLLEIEGHLPADFDYIYLQRDIGINPTYRDGVQVGRFMRMQGTPYLSTGYIIRRQMAEYILRQELCCRMPIDHLFAELAHQHIFYRPVRPLIGIQCGLTSDIHG